MISNFNQIDLVIELMQVVMDDTCDSRVSIHVLNKKINSFKQDFAFFKKWIASLQYEGELDDDEVSQFHLKLEKAQLLLQQLQVELQTLVWEKKHKL